MTRDNFTCQFCGATDKTLHVHHLKYNGAPWEADNQDLITLCEDCHKLLHRKKDVNREDLKYIEEARVGIKALKLITEYFSEIESETHYWWTPYTVDPYPTQQQVLRYLREVNLLVVNIHAHSYHSDGKDHERFDSVEYEWSIYRWRTGCLEAMSYVPKYYNSYEEAVDDAICYAFENII